MRWLINDIRSCFCKHDWEKLLHVAHKEYGYNIATGYTDVYRCKKCGYVQKVKF